MPYPLTTIFTPASSCFSDGPTFGENCGAATQVAYQSVSCFWSRPVNCWPPNPSILGAPSSQVSSVIFGDDVAGIAYEYSPGVLPTGWWAIGTSSITPSSSISTKIGCPVNWNTFGYNWCTTPVSGKYSLDGATHTGIYAAILPLIAVTWEVDDLAKFTPSRAPNLMRTAPTRAILDRSSAAARSRLTEAPAATTSTAPQSAPRTTKAPATLLATHSSTGASGATTTPSPNSSNAAALGGGIGGGIGGAILLACLLFLFLKYRQNKRKKEYLPEVGQHYDMRQNSAQFHGYPTQQPDGRNAAPPYTSSAKIASPVSSPVELPPQPPSEMSTSRIQ